MSSLYDEGGSGGTRQNSSVGAEWNSNFMMSKRDPLYIVVPMTIMYSIIFVTGVIGNSITCLVIAKHKYMHTATNYYLFSLAVSDLILLVSGLPQEMWSIWSRYPYVFGEIFCQLRGLFAEMSANATVLTITAFTAERYVAICHPFMAQSMSKLSRAVKLIVGIWLVSALFAIPQALQFTVSAWNDMPEVTQCNIRTIRLMYTDVQLSTVSFTVSTVLFFVLPMTFITVLYALIGFRLRRTDKLKRTITVRSSNGEKKSSSPEYRASSSSKVLRMLVAVVVAFFICWAPFHAQRLIAIFWSSHASSGNADVKDIPFLHMLYGISTYISGILYYVSTTINPILYHIMSLKFRAAFKETVLRCCGGGGNGGGGGGRRISNGSGAGEWRRRRRGRPRWNVRRQSYDESSVDAADGQRRDVGYRRVSSRMSSSVGLPVDDVGGGTVDGRTGRVTAAAAAAAVDRRPSSSSVSTVGLTDCWRRTLKRRVDGSFAQRDISTASTGGGGDDDDDDDGGQHSAKPPPAGTCDGRHRSAAAAALSSNWTMISNSSLRDVDGDDLRDELVGYGRGGVQVPVAEEYY